MGIDKFVGNEFGRTQCARQGENQGWFSTAHVHSVIGFDS